MNKLHLHLCDCCPSEVTCCCANPKQKILCLHCEMALLELAILQALGVALGEAEEAVN
jgi:hypothetical protein